MIEQSIRMSHHCQKEEHEESRKAEGGSQITGHGMICRGARRAPEWQRKNFLFNNGRTACAPTYFPFAFFSGLHPPLSDLSHYCFRWKGTLVTIVFGRNRSAPLISRDD